MNCMVEVLGVKTFSWGSSKKVLEGYTGHKRMVAAMTTTGGIGDEGVYMLI